MKTKSENKNVVKMINRPDNRYKSKCVPCWQTAPHTNPITSKKDIRFRTSCQMRCVNIANQIVNIATKPIFHTPTLNGKTKIFVVEARVGCRKTNGVLTDIK